MSDSHKCRSGKHCVGRSETGSAATIKQNTVCRGCADDIQRRRDELPHLARVLQSFRGRMPQTALQSKVSRSATPQCPLNLEVISVLGYIEDIISKAGNYRVRDLIARGPEKFEMWVNGRRTEQYQDGCDLALTIRKVHSKAEGMAGLAPAYEKRRAPCPRCSLPTLGGLVGSGTVVCSNGDCGWVGTDDMYQAHCLFKAEQKQ